MSQTKLSRKFWLALALFGLMGQIAWVVENMYLNVFIYKMFNASASDISAMVAASAVAATLTTILMGAFADKIGKRKIFICGGYILWGISIFCFVFLRTEIIESVIPLTVSAASVGVSLTIALDCIMTFFGSTANDAAYNAWLTDSTDSTNRGGAEGINAMMPLMAILAVFGGFMALDLNRADNWVIIFSIIGALVLLVGVLGFFIIQEPAVTPSESGFFKNLVYGFLPKTVKQNKSFYFYLLLFVLFNISIQIFMPYLILYYEVSLAMSNYVLVMAPAIVIASVVTAFWGRVYDKKGFGFSVFFSLVWLVLGYLLLFLFTNTALVFVGSLLMMCGYLAGMAVFGAKIRDLTPEGRAGMLQGVRIVAQVLLPGVVGPYIGTLVLKDAKTVVNNDGTESFVPSADIFMAALFVILLLAAVLLVVKFFQKPRLTSLTTPFEDHADTDWSEYPRPQMKRESYLPLNGKWQLYVTSKKDCRFLGNITVPFVPESRLSGIERKMKKGETYSYRRVFSLEKAPEEKQLLLHFGAVDQIARVFVNDRFVGEHVGGYLPFSFDIAPYVRAGENTLRVEVVDTLDTELAYGKQRKKRGGMWYTPISGIWQTVWMELVPQKAIQSLRLTPTLTDVTIDTVGGEELKILTLSTEQGERVYEYRGDSFTITLDEPHLWSPEDPYLYEFSLACGKDRVASYFALRVIGTERRENGACLTLNGKPYFFHGLLDQGYYSDGIYLPASPDGFRYDILTMKKLGFNMLRKHIKIEPDLFYHYCDKYGMVVFQDMVNSGKYSFFWDTALPTVGIRKGITHKASKKRRAHFEASAKETLSHLYNHPSVVYYTIFNEGWGQYDADENYRRLKAWDPTRIYDATSGWFAEEESDVVSDHVYFKKLNLVRFPERPLVLSEFGGYSCKIKGHAFNLDKTYGYRFYRERSEFAKALLTLYRDEVLPMIARGLTATVLTQVSDVEDETNGLVTYDRRVLKVEEDEMLALSAELKNAFETVWM